MGINEKLVKVQQELKAPKDSYNSFGKYKYRSCESILKAVKPILSKEQLVLILSDKVEPCGSRIYIKAKATLIDVESGGHVSVESYAREDENKKGMDGAQITGSASSYARKYALNGLFAIDDTKDADTDEYHKQTNKKISKKQQDEILSIAGQKNVNIQQIYGRYGVNKLGDMTEEQYESCLRAFQNT